MAKIENQFSRTIDLEIDGSAGQLGAKTPKEINEGSQRALFRQLGKWGAQSNVTHLTHGTYRDRPASIVGLDFRFLFEAGGSDRFCAARIEVTFTALPGQKGQSPSPRPPVVKHICPKIMEGPITRAKRTKQTEISTSLSASGAPAPVLASVGASRTDGVEYEENHRIRIKGEKWSSKDDMEDDNMIIWTLTENSKQGDGIPADFKVAILVQHEGVPFQGIVKIKATTKLNLSLFGRPWPKPNPLILSPEVSLGSSMGMTDFDELEDEHWQKMIDAQAAEAVSSNTYRKGRELTEIIIVLWTSSGEIGGLRVIRT